MHELACLGEASSAPTHVVALLGSNGDGIWNDACSEGLFAEPWDRTDASVSSGRTTDTAEPAGKGEAHIRTISANGKTKLHLRPMMVQLKAMWRAPT